MVAVGQTEAVEAAQFSDGPNEDGHRCQRRRLKERPFSAQRAGRNRRNAFDVERGIVARTLVPSLNVTALVVRAHGLRHRHVVPASIQAKAAR